MQGENRISCYARRGCEPKAFLQLHLDARKGLVVAYGVLFAAGRDPGHWRKFLYFRKTLPGKKAAYARKQIPGLQSSQIRDRRTELWQPLLRAYFKLLPAQIRPGLALHAGKKACALKKLFGFPVSMQRLPISTLSGGERRRLYLITRLLLNPNFLVLDEPTNDLDLETMENLESYILSFPGTVLISSHDRTFLDLTVDMLLVIEGRRITLFPGSYSEWKERRDSSRAEAKETEKPQAEERRPRERKGLSYKEKKEKEGIEARMEELEALILDLEASFSTPGDTELGTLRERTERYGAAKAELEGISERWLELAEKEEG